MTDRNLSEWNEDWVHKINEAQMWFDRVIWRMSKPSACFIEIIQGKDARLHRTCSLFDDGI